MRGAALRGAVAIPKLALGRGGWGWYKRRRDMECCEMVEGVRD